MKGTRRIFLWNLNKAMMTDYSTRRISPKLLDEVKDALKSIKSYGSVELYVQKNTVTQITVRTIKKTNSNSKRD